MAAELNPTQDHLYKCYESLLSEGKFDKPLSEDQFDTLVKTISNRIIWNGTLLAKHPTPYVHVHPAAMEIYKKLQKTLYLEIKELKSGSLEGKYQISSTDLLKFRPSVFKKLLDKIRNIQINNDKSRFFYEYSQILTDRTRLS